MLIGTISIEKSELLSRMLRKKGIKHEVLNAKQHHREAEIVAQAGKPGAITIATNMAGRGTNIVLGGNIEHMALSALRKEGYPDEILVLVTGFNDTDNEELIKARNQYNQLLSDYKKKLEPAREEVLKAGGLYIIGTERHDSQRIDNQLRGRSGRQGDPGSSRFYLSLEDSLMRIFAKDQVKNMMQGLGLEAGESIEHRMLSGAIERAQKRVEGRNFDIRKMLLEYDDMANEQRQIIYSQRNSVLESEDISELLDSMRQTVIENEVSTFIPEQSPEQQWDIKGLEASINHNFGLQIPVKDWLEKDSNLNEQDIAEKIYSAATASYKTKGNSIGTVMRDFEKQILLQIIDNAWKDHLGSVDYLRQGIGLRGYGSRNPKLEFRRESFGLFEELLENIRIEGTRFLARVEIELDAPEELERIQKLGRKKTVEHQNSESAFTSEEVENSTQQQNPNQPEQGNRRLRRYEAKMARKKENK